ncbi:MAG: hypothetical protein ACI8Y4_003403 [Candidatus Poriferisodalaceae bacterium]
MLAPEPLQKTYSYPSSSNGLSHPSTDSGGDLSCDQPSKTSVLKHVHHRVALGLTKGSDLFSSIALALLLQLGPADQPVVVGEARVEESTLSAEPSRDVGAGNSESGAEPSEGETLRCDGVVEVCINRPDSNWPAADLPGLCQVKPVFCGGVLSAPVDAIDQFSPVPFEDLTMAQRLAAIVVWATFEDHPVTTPEAALAITACESSWKAWAENPRSSASGLFQFIRGTWRNEAPLVGISGDLRERYNPWSAALVAAAMVERDGGWHQWSCKPH